MSAGIVTMSSSRRSAHRIAALARAEGVLLRRNRIALLTALALPVAMVFALKAAPAVVDAGGSRGVGATLLTGLTAFALLLAVYYNLVAALVARREELVLKRLRTGETTDAEILAGTAAPAIAIAWAQIAMPTVAAVAVFSVAPPANAVLTLVALILGTAVFALLAAVQQHSDPDGGDGAGHDTAGADDSVCVQWPAVPASPAARAAAMARAGTATDTGGDTDAAGPDRNGRRRSPSWHGRDLRRGSHPGR